MTLLRLLIIAFVFFVPLIPPRAQAVMNEGGFSLRSVSSELYSAGGAMNSEGNRSAWVGQTSGSSFSTSPSGFRVAIGTVQLPGQASPTPTPSTSFTPTGTPTPTQSPTVTRMGPTTTQTPCTIASTMDSFDLFEDGRIDSNDLLEWLNSNRAGEGVDFNCDNEIDWRDLILFSTFWKSGEK